MVVHTIVRHECCYTIRVETVDNIILNGATFTIIDDDCVATGITNATLFDGHVSRGPNTYLDKVIIIDVLGLVGIKDNVTQRAARPHLYLACGNCTPPKGSYVIAKDTNLSRH